MHILVTGTPGCGKTTLAQYAANKHDERFVDADDATSLCEWRDKVTGQVLGYVKDQTAVPNDEWYAKYGWYWRSDAMQELLASDSDVVLCGSAENIADYYELFDKVVILKKTEAELLANLASPERANPFGKTPAQRQNFMNWQDYLINEAMSFDPVILEGNDVGSCYQAIINLII